MVTNSQKIDLSLESFFYKHPVFHVAELDKFLSQYRTGNRNTRKALLQHYKKQGRVISIRRGIYAVVPKGADPDKYPIDQYLIASKLTEDAALSHHTALEFHGKAYSVFNTVSYTSQYRTDPLTFRSHTFLPVPAPRKLIIKGRPDYGVIRRSRSGIEIRVTSLERTLVDMLNRPDLSGSWEELWRSLESIEYFELDSLLEYIEILDNSTAAARVGYFLQQNRDALMVGDGFINKLKNLKPNQPHYFSRSNRKKCRLVKDWNLMVPTEIVNHTWSEVL